MSFRERSMDKRGEKRVSREVSNSNNMSLVTFRSYRRKHHLKTVMNDKAKEEEIKEVMSHDVIHTSQFEIGKDFVKYFKKNNRERVLAKVNKNAMKDFEPVNSKVLPMEWIDLVIFTSKINAKELIEKSLGGNDKQSANNKQ